MKRTSSIEKGTIYENFINNLLNKENISWKWKDIPEYDLRNAEILGDWNEYRYNRKLLRIGENKNNMIDLGCDILLKKNNKYYIVQCKNYQANNYVTVDQLAGFFMMCHIYNLPGILYYTSKLSKNITCHKSTERFQYIKQDLDNNDIISNNNSYSNLIDQSYEYQIDAYNAIMNTFLTENRAILQLPCGLGKTLISMKVGLNYDLIILISPLKQYCIQNLQRFKSEFKYKDYEGLIIDSDGTRDIEYILNFLNKNKKNILSVCYKSIDIIVNILNKINNYIVIIDEFHNISQNEILGLSQSGISQILHSNVKILFMSATPRLFYLDQNNDEDDIDLNKDLFGNIVYTYNMGDAIKNKKICDYEIYVPDININNNLFIDDIKKEINIDNFENEILVKSNFILRGMLETGARKCIIYVDSHQEAYKYKNCINDINEYFALELYVDTILSDDSKENRETKLQKFSDFNGFVLMINVIILNECIDKKECDSVYITYPSKSKIYNIQRISRANRIDNNNKNKISKIFIWCNEYKDEISDIIGHLKEFDNSFMIDKVKILSINNHKHQIMDRTRYTKEYLYLDNIIINIKRAYSWLDKFEQLKLFLINNKEMPSLGKKKTDDNTELKNLTKWYHNQKCYFKNRIKLMKYDIYYNIWKDFMKNNSIFFLNYTEKWLYKLEKVKEFIQINNKLPSRYSKCNTQESDDDEDNEDFSESKLGAWIASQKENYIDNKKLMSNTEIKNIWTNFIEEYHKYFLVGNELWYSRLNELKKYINENGKRPPAHSKDKNIESLSSFIFTQNKNYEQKTQIMSNQDIYDEWTRFKIEYKDILLNEYEKWYIYLDQTKKFMIENQKRPNKRSNNQNEKIIGEWIGKQIKNYRENTGLIKKYENIRNDFKLFYDQFNEFI